MSAPGNLPRGRAAAGQQLCAFSSAGKSREMSASGLSSASRAIAHDSGAFSHKRFHIVMAGLVPTIHDLSRGTKNVDARDKPGHDEFVARACAERK
jgi:hypothetical protein